jgi:hypothetical protein
MAEDKEDRAKRFGWEEGDIVFLSPEEAAKMTADPPPLPKEHPHITGEEKKNA